MDYKKETKGIARLQRSFPLGRVLRLALALLLAITLMPAFALPAFAEEAEAQEIEHIEQDSIAEDEQGSAVEEEDEQGSIIESEDTGSDANTAEEAEVADIQDVEAPDLLAIEPLATEEIDAAQTSSEVLPQSGGAAIVIQAQESGTVVITNRWTTSIIVARNSNPGSTVSAERSTPISVTRGDRITITESAPGSTFRNWKVSETAMGGLVTKLKCAIVSMPAMSVFTVDGAGTRAGNGFFSDFNHYGSLTSLPAGSFNTSKITNAGSSFFLCFNSFGSLASLPTGSFNISNITTVGGEFFSNFNSHGSLTSLPANSFNTSKITSASHSFFSSFNSLGSLTSLPAGSFSTSNIATVGDYFFSGFNSSGSLTSLPAGSFNTSNITTVGSSFFRFFNGGSPRLSLPNGSITSLPAGSFNTSRITTAGEDFLLYFNAWGCLASLPASFKLPQSLKTVGSGYCENMFYESALTRGNQAIPLYFARASKDTFLNTNITPVSPSAGTTVWVNGTPSSTGTKPKITTTTDSVHSGIVGTNYKKTLAASGTKTITWSRSSGSLPPGLSLSSAGVITGKPTKIGTYTFVVKATNSAGSTTKSFKITIGAVKITTTKDSVHAGITGINYKKTLKATGTGTITWSRASGSLPPGLKFSSAGVITGKPTKPGTYNFKVRATNSLGNTTKSFTIKVNNPSISISYQTHVQSVGWQAFKKDGAMSGTSGKALRLEGIKINLKNNTGISGGIRYSTHVQSIGWQKKVSLNTNGKSLKDVKGPMSGTSGRALRLEAITIELTGDLKKHYDIYYRVHAQSVGWMGWARNGQEAGTAGHAYRLEGIQIVLVPKVGGKKPGNTFKGITTPASAKAFIKR